MFTILSTDIARSLRWSPLPTPRIDLQNHLGRANINHYSVNSAWGFVVHDFLQVFQLQLG